MTTQRTTSTRGSRRPPLVTTLSGAVLAGVVAALLLALAPGRNASIQTAAASTSRGQGAAPYSYGWPVKPFDREYPVRAILGDPRTLFRGPPTVDTLLHAGGSFSFHQGIDISAPNGADVYPVMSGVVVEVCASTSEGRVV